MNQAHLIACPRNWEAPFQPLPNETLQENYQRVFQECLPGMEITNVVPLNSRRKPRCKWCVQFTRNQPAEPGLYKTICTLVNIWKPRNTNVVCLDAEGPRHFLVIYKVYCDCQVVDFCSDDEANLVNVLQMVQGIKLEEV